MPTMVSEIPKAPEDVPPASPVQVAAQGSSVIIEPSLNQSTDGCPSASAILKQTAALDFSKSSVHVTDVKDGPKYQVVPFRNDGVENLKFSNVGEFLDGSHQKSRE